MTMTPRECVMRALTFQHPDRAPRELWALPGVARYRQPELAAFYARFPSDFAGPDVIYGPAACVPVARRPRWANIRTPGAAGSRCSSRA